MKNNFYEIVKNKTKDELINILVNKGEYKTELISAAESELKLRQKNSIDSTNTPQPTLTPVSPVLNNSLPNKGKSPGIYFAAILLFISFPFWISIGIFQAGLSHYSGDTGLGFISIWTIFFSIASIVMGIGVLNLQKWGYDWGFGSAIINFFWFGYLWIEDHSFSFLFFILVELIIATALYINKTCFYLDLSSIRAKNIQITQNSNKNVSIRTDNENLGYNQKLIYLNQLIREEKKVVFGSRNKEQIISTLNDLCSSKDKAEDLLTFYDQLFSTDLINEIINLTTSYDAMKMYLESLIVLKIVSKEYPHTRLA